MDQNGTVGEMCAGGPFDRACADRSPPDLALPGDRVPGVVHSTKPESCTQDAAILSPRCEDVKWRGLALLPDPLYTVDLPGR